MERREIFISYIEEDGRTAQALAKELRSHGQSTWTYQEDGVAGISYLTQVHGAIEACRAFILIASARSIHAHQVIREVEQAHEREKVIVPVRLGLTHQQFIAANPILRMASGTAVTLSATEDNLADVAQRIATTIRFSQAQSPPEPQQNEGMSTPVNKVDLSGAEGSGAPQQTRIDVAIGTHQAADVMGRMVRRPAYAGALVILILGILATQVAGPREFLERMLGLAETRSASNDPPSTTTTRLPEATAPPVQPEAPAGRNQFTASVPVPANINTGLSSAKRLTLLTLLGPPCNNPANECKPSSPKLDRLVVFEDIGPFKVRGLRPAVETLRRVFADVKRTAPELYAIIGAGTAGMMCCRLVRGSESVLSNHSWGTSIDLTIDGVLDRPGDGNTQVGLLLLAPFFNKEGFYWGAGAGTEDAMHFEASDGLVRTWHERGLLGDL